MPFWWQSRRQNCPGNLMRGRMGWIYFVMCGMVLWGLMSCTSALPPTGGQSEFISTSSAPQIALNGQAPAIAPTDNPLPTATPGLKEINQLFPFLFPTETATATAVPTLIPLPTATPKRCDSPGQMVTGAINSTNSYAGSIAYRVYLPPCYGQDGRFYPTLYMLPGNIHTDAIWDELGMDETAEAAILNNEMPPFLIVMLSGGWLADNTSGGVGSYEQFFMEELIPAVEETYCAWPDGRGRALGGMSRGGYWALEIGFLHSEQFNSVGGHSAVLYDFYAGPELNPQFTGVNNDLDDLRVYLDIGENDGYLPNLRTLHEEMSAAGIPHEWLPNEGYHEDGYWREHIPEYLDWYTETWSRDRNTYPVCK